MDQNSELSPAGHPAPPGQADSLPEQFVPDHLFLYLAAGELRMYDGHQRFTLQAGDYYLVRKNRLVRYDYGSAGAGCEMTYCCLDESSLRAFEEKYPVATKRSRPSDTFVALEANETIAGFIRSLKPYRNQAGSVAEAFRAVKHEELLLILLQNQPELADILFDYGIPGKIDLEKFMNSHFKFNVGLPRFAFLTGRSLSAFKRDFQAIFHQTPSRWLVQKRLQEAYFLLDEQHEKPANIYFELGFKDLSHFSFAFKNRFGLAPSELLKKRTA